LKLGHNWEDMHPLALAELREPSASASR